MAQSCCGDAGRDLKLENILMAADGTVKLSDFGLGSLAEAGTGPDGLLRTVCGTPNYAAPEVLLEQPYDGAAADLWSLGAGTLHLNPRNQPLTQTGHAAPPSRVLTCSQPVLQLHS